VRTSGPSFPSGRSAASTGQATVWQIRIMVLASVVAVRNAAVVSTSPLAEPRSPGWATKMTSTSLT
jgi:hypothetical protein